jgi:hypothetical protein
VQDWAESGEGFLVLRAGTKALAIDASGEGAAETKTAASPRTEKMSLLKCMVRLIDCGCVVMIGPNDGEEDGRLSGPFIL